MGRPACTKRLTVEQCLKLSVIDLHRNGVFASHFGRCWIQWNVDGTTRRMEFAVVETPGQAMGLRFDSESLRCVVEVTTSKPQFGGRRFWLRCPMVRDGMRCRRRVGCLYLPPGRSVFGCRVCYYLTYLSSQKHDKRVSALLRDPLALAAALQSADLAQNLLGIRAYRNAVARIGRLSRSRIGG
jgi:hypothetical protein